MFGWLDELLNLRLKYKEYRLRLIMEANQCQSCEVLRTALERSNYEKDQLLRKVLNTDDKTEPPKDAEPQNIKRHVPWNVRRQILEAEDREKFRILQQFREQSIETLEKNMDISDSAKPETEDAERKA